jgi:hypothetical protein
MILPKGREVPNVRYTCYYRYTGAEMGNPTVEKTSRSGKEAAYDPHLLQDYTGEPYRTQVRNPVCASEVRKPGCAHA